MSIGLNLQYFLWRKMLLGPHDTVFDMVLSLINLYVIETNRFFFFGRFSLIFFTWLLIDLLVL